jgi:hypothetical protein
MLTVVARSPGPKPPYHELIATATNTRGNGSVPTCCGKTLHINNDTMVKMNGMA